MPIEGEWKLSRFSISGVDQSITPLLATMSFGSDGRVVAYDGSNTISGNYEVSSEIVSLRSQGSTAAAIGSSPGARGLASAFLELFGDGISSSVSDDPDGDIDEGDDDFEPKHLTSSISTGRLTLTHQASRWEFVR